MTTMLETITSITHTEWNDRGPNRAFGYMEGYEIVTNLQTIRVGISNEQNCCEVWGVIISEDTPEDFIGATLLGVRLTDTALNVRTLNTPKYLEAGGVMFVDLVTSRGVFQIALYNAHNGYYGHDVVVHSHQLNTKTVL